MQNRIEYYKSLGLGLLRTSEVILTKHNPKWREAFLQERETLIAALNIPSLILVHCGSTSIPGIFAKPILDILGGVDSITDIDARKESLEALGYEFKGEYGIPGRRYCTFYGEDKTTSYVHLHIFERTHYEFYKHLVFAHYLRSSKEVAAEYENLKLHLVKQKNLPRSEYSNAKNDVIQKLQKEAEAKWPFGTDLNLLSGNTSQKSHWENVYSTKADEQLSWTQPSPGISLEWILESLLSRDIKIIDIGGGISELTDRLLDENFRQPTVLDISGAALERAKKRLGEKASLVNWIESDITAFVPTEKYSLWHDRAVFHFLVNAEDRKKYVDTLKQAILPNGFVLIATFTTDGPSKCSGLEVIRYNEESLSQELGPAFHLIKSRRHTHTTPWGSQQEFIFCLFRN